LLDFHRFSEEENDFHQSSQVQATKFPQIRDPFNRENPSDEEIVLRMTAGH